MDAQMLELLRRINEGPALGYSPGGIVRGPNAEDSVMMRLAPGEAWVTVDGKVQHYVGDELVTD